MGLSPIHIILLLAVVLLLFGSGRVSNLMGDVAKGIKSFKKGMNEEEEPAPPPRRLADERPLEARPVPPTAAPAEPVPPVTPTDHDRRA